MVASGAAGDGAGPDPALAGFPSHAPATRRWCFADQLGPHFLDEPDQPVLLIESRAVFARRRFHRQKAHLVLSALRHRAAELGDQAEFHQVDTYAEALDRVREPLTVCAPDDLEQPRLRAAPRRACEVLAARGFVTTHAEFAAWADGRGRRRLLMEDFYRDSRRRHDVLMDGAEPVGGRWNLDDENREPPPADGRIGVPEPWWPEEDEIDAGVRADLDRWEAEGLVSFVGDDGPRLFPVTRAEALHRLEDFLEHRLGAFGPHEDAMLAGDRWLAHSLLSPALNLGLLDPLEVVARDGAERPGPRGRRRPAPAQQRRGVRPAGHGLAGLHLAHVLAPRPGLPRAQRPRRARGRCRPGWPTWTTDAVDAACLSGVLGDLRRDGWVHHIPRLMVLGNYALQRGIDPSAMTDWFHESFVDGYEWVMVANVVGMSQHADGGVLATKPYASGGAYIDRMSDYCGGCRYDPRKRLGDDACPYTAGYWAFLDRTRDRLAGNHRMRRPLQGLDRLKDLPAVVEQEQQRGTDPL